MRTAIGVFSVLLALGGCATQEPVKIVDAVCDSTSCMGELAQLRQQSRAELEACHQARSRAEDCCRQKGEVQQRLQAEQDARLGVEKALADRSAELARCQGDLEALRQKAQADAAACEALRQDLQKTVKVSDASARQLQRMKDLEDSLRQRLQGEIGAKDVEIERLRSQLSVRVLDRILFESGSADILLQGRRVLDAVGAALAGGDETIRIEGHADTVPIGPYLKQKYPTNWELSAARASSVVRYFEDRQGIQPTRMEAVGFSKYRPIAANDTEENRQRNRRVEIVLTPWKPVVEECGPQP